MKNKQSFKTVWRNNVFLIRHCFKASPWGIISTVLDGFRHEFIVFLEFTVAFNYILESVEFGRSFRDVAVFIGVLTAVVALSLLYCGFYSQKWQAKAVLAATRDMNKMLYQKTEEIDLECFDNPEYYNEYILAVSEAGRQVERTFELLRNLAMGFTALICSAGFFLVKDPISMLFVAISFFASYYVSKALSVLSFKIKTAKNPHERKLGYTNRVFYLSDYAKEMRLNPDVGGKLLEDFEATNDSVLNVDKKNAPRRFSLEFLKNYICNDFIMDVLYITYLVYSAAVLRRISYSSVAVMHSTSSRAKDRMRFISDAYPYAQETSLFVSRILKFLDTPSKITALGNLTVPEAPCAVELRNVSFRYNDKDDFVLRNVSMKIEPYSKIAIVGYNGAGKTTLIKLIMRLYDPDEGEILYNGVNIKHYDIADYRRRIGAVFQDFKIFAATVKENVLLSHADSADNEAVLAAVEKSGFLERLSALPRGLETNLTTEFDDDGVNLSGGEGQRLAIARVFARQTGLIILDEPSSALDPIAEYHINRALLDVSSNKSVIFISHRLSTTRIADRIYMLENGRIIESGSHDDLLVLGGKYTQMWHAQAGQYN